MKEFTRFETQYIMMLALRAKQDLKEELKGQSGYIDPNLEKYIKSLRSIALKAKLNLREYDERESVEPIDIKENPSGYKGFVDGVE